MTSRNITKALIGLEDLLTGVGTETQVRGGNTLTLSKLDIAVAVTSQAAMQALDVAKYTRARVYSGESNFAEYVYDSTSLAGISSDTGPGTWLPAPSFARTLSVEDKLSLRLVEPSFNLQIAIALGATALGVGFGGVYYYDEDSIAADDGDLVFVTTGGARWLKLSFESQELSKVSAAGGGANALTASFGLTTVPQDQVFWLRAVFTNTGEVTLDLDGLGAAPVVFADDSVLVAGAIEATKTYGFVYTGTSYRLLNPSVSQLTAEAGVANFGVMTPLRVEQRLAAVLQAIANLAIDIEDVTDIAYGEEISNLVYTASGTWVKPPCDPNDTVIVEIWGAGGSGAVYADGTNEFANGGLGGAYWKAYFRASELLASEPVTVGVGGAAVSGSANTNGNHGGYSRFKDIIAAGGSRATVFTPPTDPYTLQGHGRITEDFFPIGSVDAFNIDSGIGKGAGIFATKASSAEWFCRQGQSAQFGGGAGGSVGKNPVDPISAPGGKSIFGGDGGAAASGTGVTASAGTAPGGGGGSVRRKGGTCTSGAGARGEVRIRVIKGWHPEGFSHG